MGVMAQREGGMSVGPCGPLRVAGWVWGTLGGRTGSYSQAQPRKTLSLCQTLHQFPSSSVCLYVWVQTCPCPRVCVPLHVSLSSVCISCPCVFVKRHTCGCACISLHTPGPVCIHFSPRAPRVNVCVSLCACSCMGLYSHACVWLC